MASTINMTDYPSLYVGDQFCGGDSFWDYNLTWFSAKPALTPCFLLVTPIWIPCLFLWLVSIAYVPSLYIRPLRLRARRSYILTICKLVFTLGAFICTIADLGVSTSHHVGANSLPPVYYISPMILALTICLAAFLIFFERRSAVRSSLPLFIFWGLSSIIHLLTFQHYIRLHAGIIPESPLLLGLESPRGIVFYFFYFFTIAAFIAHCFVEPSIRSNLQVPVHISTSTKQLEEEKAAADADASLVVDVVVVGKDSPADVVVVGKDSPADEASILSKMYFEWMTPLVRLGGKRPLKQEDLWNLSRDNTTAAIGAQFNDNWDMELRRFEAEVKKTKSLEVPTAAAAAAAAANRDSTLNNGMELTPVQKFDPGEDPPKATENGASAMTANGASAMTANGDSKANGVAAKRNGAVVVNGTSETKDGSSKTDKSPNKEETKKKKETPKKGPSPAFFRMLVKTYFGSMLRSALLRAFVILFELTQPTILGWLIDHVGKKPVAGDEAGSLQAVCTLPGVRVMTYEEWVWKGVCLALLLGAISYLKSTFHQFYFWFSTWDGIRFQTATIQAVYLKSLRLDPSARQDSTVGEIVNLMSVDASKFVMFLPLSNTLWVAPVQVGITLYLLWLQLGPACLAGVLVMLLMIPLNAFTGTKIRNLQLQMMTLKDSRVKLMNEILNGMKVLKLYAWEPSFLEKVSAIRDEETGKLKIQLYWSAVITLFFSSAPIFVAIAAFTAFILASPDNVLDAKTAFVSVSLFNVMRFPLNMMPQVAIMLFQILISVKRISDFLVKEEVDDAAISYDPPSGGAIKVTGGQFSWTRGEPLLRNINFSVPKKSLVSIVGSVGCGKSSLISALLGEMHKDKGEVQMTHSVAFVSQAAWIQNVTLRENILFGNKFHEEKYNKVIKACALEPDLEILPAGDATEIGEKGINLSGGQKLRVSLARAVYADKELYLLDDPLSAVDAHVGKHIFEEVIGPSGLLQAKTRVLVSNALQYLPQSHLILALKDGRIAEQGPYEELMAKPDGEFGKFVRTFTERKQEEEEEDDEEDNDDNINNEGDDVLVDSTSFSPRQAERSASLRSRNSTASASRRRRRKSSSTSTAAATARRKSVASISKKDSQKKDVVVDDGKLIEAEGMETGGISISVFFLYLRSMGWVISILVIVMMLLNRLAEVGTNFWLSHWTEQFRIPTVANANCSRVVSTTSAAASASTTATSSFVASTINSTSVPFDTPSMASSTTGNNSGAASSPEFFLGIYALFGIGAGVFMTIASFFRANGTQRASKKLHRSLAARIMACPMSFFDTVPLGRILNRFSKDMDTVDTVLGQVIFFFYLVTIYIIFSFITIAIVTPLFLVVFPVLGFFYIFLQRIYIATSRQLKRLESVSKSPIYSLFGETIQGASTIRAFRRQDAFHQELHNRVDQNMKAWYATTGAERWLGFRLEVIGALVQVFAAIFAITSSSITPGDVGLSITYAVNVTAMLSWWIKNLSDMENNLVAVERIQEYCNLPTEKPWRLAEKPIEEIWPNTGSGSFENCSIRYREGLDLVLKELNFTIKDGERIGIVGRTGAGKSSLTLALFRILEAASGSINLSEKNIADIGLHDLREKISIIPQDPVVFSGTLRLNLDPFNRHSDAELWEVLSLAHLKDFVSGLDAGLDFACAEYGDNLSIGQRQLVCLARALLRRSRILVLDEATAAVDLETDALVQKTIRESFSSSTILTIAHRLNTIIDYSRVMVLDKGRIIEFDSPQNLLADTKSAFYGMAKDAGLV